MKKSTQTCNFNKVEEKTVGGEMLNDNRWYQIDDGPKFNYFKLVNIVKICVNTILLISFLEIWFLF